MSEKFPITPTTLRYYEKIGLLPHIPRSSNGNRYYDEHAQYLVELVICLRGSGVSVESLIKYVALEQEGDETISQRIAILQEQLDELLSKKADLDRSIQRLENKISEYNEKIKE